MKKDAPQYLLRLPNELRERLKERASENDRSMNAEMLCALERHLDAGDRLEELESRIAALEAIHPPRI